MGLLLLMGNSFSGAIDSLGTGLESAWSVGRRLRAAYSGPVIRVRRSSDNAEQDFSGSGADGAVSASAVAAFCGAGDGYITTIYGQSGLSRNLVQSTTTLQPIVCESGTAVTQGGRLAAKFVAASAQIMSVASSTSIYNFLHTTGGSCFYVCKVNDTAVSKTLFANKSGTTTQGIIAEFGTDELLGVYAGRRDVAGVATNGRTITWNPTPADTNHHIAALNIDPDNGTAGSRAVGWKNGTAYTGTNADTATPFVENALNDLVIGNRTGVGGSPFDGTLQELIIWSTIQSNANRDAYESNAGSFYGITVA